MPVEKRRFTPELYEHWKKSRDAAIAEKDEVIADFRLMRLAASEESFTGRLRRAIHKAPMLLPDLCERAGIGVSSIGGFLRGEEDLDSATIDRLVTVLGWSAIVAAEPSTNVEKHSLPTPIHHAG